jgi:cyclophilin family peptidyl-prolyl cis-trans isomerase
MTPNRQSHPTFVDVVATTDAVDAGAPPHARRPAMPFPRALPARPATAAAVALAVGALAVGALVVGACATSKPPARPDPRETVARLEVQRAPATSLGPTLADVDADARRRAVLALARLERLDAIPGILGALADVDDDVRVTAAFAAGQIDLAIDPQRPAHEARRTEVEAALVARLQVERAPAVRLSLLRALGRVAAQQGLQALVAVCRSGGAVQERATAFVALGVAGARRKASLSRDEAVRDVVEQGLQDKDTEVVEGAAYAAFRQRLRVGATALAAARSSPSAQARIFVARTAPFVDVDVARDTLAGLLRDDDWRVRTEAIRAVAARHDVAVGDLAETLGRAVQRAKNPANVAERGAVKGPPMGAGEQHVVREACLALADIGAPAEALPAVQAAVTGLSTVDAPDARCTCAGAADVLGAAGDLEACTLSLPRQQQARHAVVAIAHRRVSSGEKLAALRPYVNDDDVRVRVAAAGELCGMGGVEAADVAATRLLVENDPGVGGALLECFADDDNRVVLRDSTIAAAAARFVDDKTPEAVEPLLALAALARKRPALEGLVESLKTHPDARVRDVALDVPAGERSAGPRAVADPPPRTATLPLAAVLKTSRGEITIAFARETAPVAVATFVTLARKGAYRGTPFHRVIADFVAQGGDPRGDGAGGPGFSIPCENSDEPFSRGAVGIATAGKDTGGSQFFLVHSAQPHLDGRYTLFASVTDGLDVMDALQKDDVLLDVDVVTALRKTVH